MEAEYGGVRRYPRWLSSSQAVSDTLYLSQRSPHKLGKHHAETTLLEANWPSTQYLCTRLQQYESSDQDLRRDSGEQILVAYEGATLTFNCASLWERHGKIWQNYNWSEF